MRRSARRTLDRDAVIHAVKIAANDAAKNSQNPLYVEALEMAVKMLAPEPSRPAESQSGERVCVKCGHNNVNSKGECRQCIDWQKHQCVFASEKE